MTDLTSSAPRRGRPRNDAGRRAILNAAYALLAESRDGSAPIEAIAARAGVSKQTIYRWWSDKADLYLEALHTRAIALDVAPTGDIERDLSSFLRELFGLIRTDIAQLMRALAISALRDEVFAGRLSEAFASWRNDTFYKIVNQAGAIETHEEAGLLWEIASGAMWRRIIFNVDGLDTAFADVLAGRLARAIT
ncbi:MAG: TetR/AcrR family transcriptional regulator [Parvularculaceae bacterium]|nr:TetR/AcrR family transcriptional regulator [Parvularculaceae bacterium]